MNKRKKSILTFCCLFGFWALASGGGPCRAQAGGLPSLWEVYAEKAAPAPQGGALRKAWELYVKRASPPLPVPRPGGVVGGDIELSAFMRRSDWSLRASGYELYFASSVELARSVYGLAVQSGDVDPAMSPERFEKGVLGFHYSIAQVCLWIDAVLAGGTALRTGEERQLLLRLLKDGVVDMRGGKAVPGGRIHHVLGAAPGKKRSFEATLRHERLHVLWDENPSFAAAFREKWRALGEEEKQAARKKLAAYAQDNEAQLMEEWAVFQAENMPEAERKSLVGL